MSALFPDHASPFDARFIEATWFNGAGVTLGTALLRECQRCGAWITAVPRHEAWHRSVDTDQTTDVSRPVAESRFPFDPDYELCYCHQETIPKEAAGVIVPGTRVLGPIHHMRDVCEYLDDRDQRATMVPTDTQGNRHDGSTGSSITDQSDAADGEGTRREGR